MRCLASFILLGWIVSCHPAVAGEAAAAGAEGTPAMLVGVGTADITPPVGYPMSGYFSERGATGTLDPLYAKAIVFRQGDAAAAVVVCDLLGIYPRLTETVREKIAAKTGLPPENVIVAATHSHTGPDYGGDLAKVLAAPSEPAGRERYVPFLIDRIVSAVVDADAAVAPMTLRAGAGEEAGVSFNRRFVLKDGSVRTWARSADDDVVRVAGPIDPSVGLLTVERPDGDGPVAALVNFSLHLDTVGGTLYSGDFPGHIERVLRREFGPEFTSVFATGPCGDINHADPTGMARRTSAQIGERLAAAASKAVPNLGPITPSLAVRRAVVELPLQTYTPADLAEATDLIARHKVGEKFPTVKAARAYKTRRLHRLRTGLADSGRGFDTPPPVAAGPRESLPAEVQVVRLGKEAAMVALPGEIFVELGLAIKARSPFPQTFVIELANDNPAYVPTREAMKQGGYEAENSIYAAGGGETLVETAVGLLNDLSVTPAAPSKPAAR